MFGLIKKFWKLTLLILAVIAFGAVDWHMEINDYRCSNMSEHTQVPGAPVVAASTDAEILEQAARAGKVKLFDKRTPEYYKAVAVWKEWNKKFDELHVLDMEAGQVLIDALPTKEEARQYENDEQFKRDVNRKAREALDNSFEIGAMIRAHEAKKPPFPYIR